MNVTMWRNYCNFEIAISFTTGRINFKFTLHLLLPRTWALIQVKTQSKKKMLDGWMDGGLDSYTGR